MNITIKVSQAAVEILCHDDNRTWNFTRQQYEVNGQIPSPACVEREEWAGATRVAYHHPLLGACCIPVDLLPVLYDEAQLA